MFIRYLSHEMRTPLNTVMMGLQHLFEDVAKDDSGECLGRIEILKDIKESCEIAVKTLNNMLVYDNIESGNLVLKKEDVKIIPCVENIIKLSQLQVVGKTQIFFFYPCLDIICLFG